MRILASIVIALLCASFGSAQSASSKHVEVTAKPLPGKIKKGSTFNVELRLKIAKGWHINSNDPSQEYMIGTAFVFEPREGFEVSDIRYPEGKSVKLAISETPLSVYDETISIIVTFKISNNVAHGKASLIGRLTFQACNDQICVAPSTVPVTIPIDVAG
jgi:thiol:disulfide interchange protein DsbD